MGRQDEEEEEEVEEDERRSADRLHLPTRSRVLLYLLSISSCSSSAASIFK